MISKVNLVKTFDKDSGNALLYLISMDETLVEKFTQIKYGINNPLVSDEHANFMLMDFYSDIDIEKENTMNPYARKLFWNNIFYLSAVLHMLENVIGTHPEVMKDIIKHKSNEIDMIEDIHTLYQYRDTEIKNTETVNQDTTALGSSLEFALRLKTLFLFLMHYGVEICEVLDDYTFHHSKHKVKKKASLKVVSNIKE